jgi:hypothetical protein
MLRRNKNTVAAADTFPLHQALLSAELDKRERHGPSRERRSVEQSRLESIGRIDGDTLS